jgi:membrane protein DedA with SNARE-associated domain/rhodanese-related sulfurtransferase
MQNLVTIVGEYGLLAVFVNVLLQAAGLPIPAYPILIVATAVAAGSNNRPFEIFLTGLVATMISDLGWYWAGRRYGRRVLSVLCRISLSPDSCVRRTETTFEKLGPSSLGFVKFVPGLSNVAVAVAAMTGLGLVSFVILDGLGTALFIGVPVLLGVLFQGAVEEVLDVLGQLGKSGIVLLIAAFALFLLRKWWRRRLFIRQLRMDRITIEELRDMIESGSDPVILDIRGPELRRREGIIPGSIVADAGALTAVLRDYPADTELVVYCSCPNEASAASAALHLKKAGFTRIRPLKGGIEAWGKAGHPIDFAAFASLDAKPSEAGSLPAAQVVTERGAGTARSIPR